MLVNSLFHFSFYQPISNVVVDSYLVLQSVSFDEIVDFLFYLFEGLLFDVLY